MITPYSGQEKLVNSKIGVMNKDRVSITVSTVDSYQGQERDVILVSTVRNNPKGMIGFLTDRRRINVGLTRAKDMLVVVGNVETLSSNNYWRNYWEWAR